MHKHTVVIQFQRNEVLTSLFLSEDFLCVKRDCRELQERKVSLKGESQLALVSQELCCDLMKLS